MSHTGQEIGGHHGAFWKHVLRSFMATKESILYSVNSMLSNSKKLNQIIIFEISMVYEILAM